jgi:hypothetical protein
MVFIAGCGGSPKVNEHDGAEINALLGKAQLAILEQDQESFSSLFAPACQQHGQEAWQSIQEIRFRIPEQQWHVVTAHPELVRDSHDKHVCALTLHAWFDYSRPYCEEWQAYHVEWALVRSLEDTPWQLAAVKLEEQPDTYDPLISELHIMPESAFQALNMSGQQSISPAPLLERTLQALAAGDMDALWATTTGGSLFRALDAGISMQKIDASERAGGRQNRMQIYNFYLDQANNLRDFAQKLRVEPLDLVPYFNAYTVAAMPQHCTKLELKIHFEGAGVPQFSKGLAVSWAAAYVKESWLVESMYIDLVEYYEYHLY